MVFGDPAARAEIGRLIHPLVRERMNQEVCKLSIDGERAVVLDIPLLVESETPYPVDEIWLVYATEEQRLTRIMERDGLSADDAKARMASQMPLSQKMARVQRVINNTGSLVQLRREVVELWQSVCDSKRIGE